MTESDTFVEPPVFYCTDAIHRDIQDRARAEATAATEQLRERIEEWREPEPLADMERGWNRALDAVLAILDSPEKTT